MIALPFGHLAMLALAGMAALNNQNGLDSGMLGCGVFGWCLVLLSWSFPTMIIF